MITFTGEPWNTPLILALPTNERNGAPAAPAVIKEEVVTLMPGAISIVVVALVWTGGFGGRAAGAAVTAGAGV